MGAGRSIGLTDAMQKELATLLEKPKLTELQEAKKIELIERSKCKAEFSLSETATSYIEGVVNQRIYKYDNNFTSKETEKGIYVEPESIELYNHVFDKSFEKNMVYKKNDWICGTADVVGKNLILDIKSSWSLLTFPKTQKDAKNALYEWQVRAYMMLWKKEFGEIAHCMVDTPDNLIAHEFNLNLEIHKTRDIPKELLVTVVKLQRDLDIEEKIKEKVLECRRYANFYANVILSKNK
jgi:hypothetical protein